MAEALKNTRPDFDIDAVRRDFPALQVTPYGKPLVYLDNAASAQKPVQVTDTMRDFANGSYANVHRGLHYLSNQATDAFEAARKPCAVSSMRLRSIISFSPAARPMR